jgi:hypothetical protein
LDYGLDLVARGQQYIEGRDEGPAVLAFEEIPQVRVEIARDVLVP